jgi:hypothetical protein
VLCHYKRLSTCCNFQLQFCWIQDVDELLNLYYVFWQGWWNMSHTTGCNINTLYQINICICFLEWSKTMLNNYNCFVHLVVEGVLCKLNVHTCQLANPHMLKIHIICKCVDTWIRQELIAVLWYLSSFQFILRKSQAKNGIALLSDVIE